MNFVMELPVLTHQKRESYNFILVIINRLIKIVYFKLVKVIIFASGLAEVIINVVMRHHGLPDSIISNRRAIFTSKF